MKLITLVLLIGIMSSSFGQELNCNRFKNGSFKLMDSLSGNTIITRQGKSQIEFNSLLNLRVKFKVKWIDDCTYELKYKKVLDNPNNIELSKKMILTVKIIETRKKSYIQEVSSNVSDLIIRNEVFKYGKWY